MTLHRRLAALATCLSFSAALLLHSAPSALAANCPAVEAIAVPGTTQTNPQADPDKPVGVLGNILEPLRKNSPVRLVTYYTPYPATIVGGTDAGGYRASKNAGIDATNARLKAVADACPKTVFILTGYSQGADVAGDVAAAIGHNRGVIPRQPTPRRRPCRRPLTGPRRTAHHRSQRPRHGLRRRALRRLRLPHPTQRSALGLRTARLLLQPAPR